MAAATCSLVLWVGVSTLFTIGVIEWARRI